MFSELYYACSRFVNIGLCWTQKTYCIKWISDHMHPHIFIGFHLCMNCCQWKIDIQRFPSKYITKVVLTMSAICLGVIPLTHWGRVTHIYVSNPTIIGSDNGLSPSRRQAIIWTNAEILLIRPIGTNFSEMLIEIHIFSLKKMHFKWSPGKWRPFCPGFNVF